MKTIYDTWELTWFNDISDIFSRSDRHVAEHGKYRESRQNRGRSVDETHRNRVSEIQLSGKI